MKTYFDKTVPSKSKYGKSGDGELDRRVAEYQDRFGIDLDAISEMSTVREVILARNCCIHSDGWPDPAYAARTKQKLLDERGMINITSEQFDMVVKDVTTLAFTLAEQLRRFRNSLAISPNQSA